MTIDLTKIEKARTIIKNNEKWYVLRDLNFIFGYKSYDPKRFLKNIKSENVCKLKVNPEWREKWLCTNLNGINEFIKNTKIKTKQRYSVTQKENIARKYGWSYGFVTAHISCGDLERQIEYAEKYCKPKKEIKRYDKRGFLHQSFMQ